MDVRLKKTGDIIRLNKNNFIASGGEGQIYAKNGIVYKIFLDSSQTIPYAKIQELSLISDNRVIKPEDLLFDKRGNAIGYSMKYIPNTFVLCQTFPKIFRDREHLENETVLNLVLQLREMISNIHKAKILVVDLNEMNFIVDKKFKEIYGIDANSYQTPSFPATALMESVRDRHSKTFSELTDWFSFGIVSFLMFVGIHPFKGRHPAIRYPQDKMREMDERMIKNIPVFHKDVTYPSNVLPFDVIPQVYKEWYKAIFVKGQRIVPPFDAVEVILVPSIIREQMDDKDFTINEMYTYSSDLIDYISIDGTRIAVTKDFSTFVEGKETCNTGCTHFSITPKNNVVVGGKIENRKLKMYDVFNGQELKCDISSEEIFSYRDRIYIKNIDNIFEIEFVEMRRSEIKPIPRLVGKIMENSSYIGRGVIIQNVLGRYVVSIFPKTRSHYQIPIKELDGYKIIEAKYDSNVLIIVVSKNGKYDKFIVKFDEFYKLYSIKKEEDISYCGINFVVLENGITIHINELEEMELFHNSIDSSTVKILKSPAIRGDMKLFKDGAKVLFSKNKKLYRLQMK